MARVNKAVAEVLDHFNAAEMARRPRDEVWEECYRLYRSYTEPLSEDDSDLSNIFVPKIFADIETITPRIVLTAIGRRPWVEVKPREQDDIIRAQLASKLLQAQFDRQGMFRKLLDFVKQALIYGTSPAQIGWRYEVHQQQVRVMKDRVVNGQNLTQELGMSKVMDVEEQVVADWDDPWFEVIDVQDFFPDPDAKRLDEMAFVIRREFTSPADMERAGVYDNIKAAVEAGESSATRPWEERLASVGLGASQAAGTRSRPIELLHYWTRDRLVVVANRSVVVRDEPNPYYHGRLPFVVITDTPVPNEFWGIGTAEVLKDLQHELNTIRNQRRDNVSLAIQRMFVAARNAGINPNDLVWRPGGVVWVDDLADVNKLIQPIEVPDVTSSSYVEEQQLHKDMEEVTAVSDFFRGALTQSKRTATEIQQAAIGGNARVDLKVRLFAEDGLKEIARHFLDLNRQFLTTERVVRFVGELGREEWLHVGPGDLQFAYDDLIPAAANIESWANRLQQRDDLLRFIQIMGRAPMFAQMLNWRKILEKILETYDFAEVENLLVSESQGQMLQQTVTQQIMPTLGMTNGNLSTALLKGLMPGASSAGQQPQGNQQQYPAVSP